MEIFLFSDLSYACSSKSHIPSDWVPFAISILGMRAYKFMRQVLTIRDKSITPCGIQTRVAWFKEVRPSQTDPNQNPNLNQHSSTNIKRLLTRKKSQMFIIGCGCCKWKCWYLSLNEGTSSTLVLLLM